jgi:hypothetical protein
MTSPFHFLHSCGTHEQRGRAGARASIEQALTALTPGEAQASRDVQPSTPASPGRDIVWKILVIHRKTCYHRRMKVAG